MQSLFFSSSFLISFLSLSLIISLKLVSCISEKKSGDNPGKQIAALLQSKQTTLLGIGLLPGTNRRRRLLVVIGEKTESGNNSSTAGQLHSALFDLKELDPEGPLVVSSSRNAVLQSLPIANLSTSALGGLILQDDTGRGAFGWAQFKVQEREGGERGGGGGGGEKGTITLDWYRHPKLVIVGGSGDDDDAIGALEKVQCSYTSDWMRAFVHQLPIFSSNQSGAFSYLLDFTSELLPGAYSVTEGDGRAPILSISSSYSPRLLNTTGELNATIEGGFILGRHHLLYALDNTHRKVYLYRLEEVGEASFKSTAVPLGAELPFSALIRFLDEPPEINSSGGAFLYLVAALFILALVAFLAYAFANHSAKNLVMVNHFAFRGGKAKSAGGGSGKKSSTLGHTGGEIKKSRTMKLGGGGGTQLTTPNASSSLASSSSSGSSTSGSSVSHTPPTNTLKSTGKSAPGAKGKEKGKSPNEKSSPKVQAPPPQQQMKQAPEMSAISRPAGSIFI